MFERSFRIWPPPLYFLLLLGSMLTFTTIIKGHDGSQTVSNEALLPLPPELSDGPRLNAYLQISSPGWSKQEFGYWNYARLHENGDLYIYPALYISGEPAPRKRFGGYATQFSRYQIEVYAEQVENMKLSYQRDVEDEFNLLVHDLRQLSTSIHHTTEEAFRYLSEDRPDIVNSRLQSIMAMQQMLSIRTDLLDYSGNAHHYTEAREVAVYRKVDKVVKSFAAYAATKGISLHKAGSSIKKSAGPDVLEIVPYVLLDNAIKYSPKGNDIDIKIHDAADTVRFSVKSAGPIITPEERKSIFEKGVRGDAARRSGIRGSGAGLFVAKQVVDQFGGKISVETSSSEFIIDDIRMTDVTFHVELPAI